MKLFTTFRTRLLLTFLGLLIIGFGGLTWFAGRQMAENRYDNAEQHLEVIALNIASDPNENLEDINEEDEEGKEDEEGIVTKIRDQIKDTFDLQNIVIFILDINRNIIDSDDPSSPTNEIRDEHLSGLDKDISGSDRDASNLYAFAKVVGDEEDGDAEIFGYIYLIEPIDATRQQVWTDWRLLGLVLIGFSTISMICSHWLLSSVLRPLSQLGNTALRMAKGDLSQRVTDPKQDEIGEVGQAFNQMADRVTAILDEQRAFASNAAHELRTPLTTIRLRTESLRSGSLEPTTTEQYITEIDNEAKHMSGLVDDLFLLSQLDSKRLPIGSEQIDALRLARKVCSELGPLAEQKSVVVTLDEPTTLLPPTQTTIGHLHMVIRNLLENAIKYTPQNGQVRIRLSSHSAGKNLVGTRQYLQIEISDTGQGIAQEDLLRITQRFYRDAKARSRQAASGSGLGLALVDSIIKLYSGHLRITSPGSNQGTIATVLWPFQQEGMTG